MTLDARQLEQANELIRLALAEDLGPGDVTTDVLSLADSPAVGRMVAKEDGVLAGTPVVDLVFARVDERCELEWAASDGDAVSVGQEILRMRGPARALLAAERPSLNFLQRLSGIATCSRDFMRRVEGTNARVLDTRKTTPGWRYLEKYAVALGGGTNHRVGLFDQALFKENHVALARAAGESLEALIRNARERTGQPVVVEVRDMAEAKDAHAAGAEILMLDNMTHDAMREAVEHFGALPESERPELEASGGINLETIGDVARTGVDRISCGALTHSPKALDISMYVDAAGDASAR